jgi:predicted amidohydrolase YtcJ
VGNLADLVVLDRPCLTIDDEEIKQMKPLLTWWVAA